nr:hypothetical protein [Mycolicibacterium komanii]CRL78344.1 hypothetical protein CPGR_05173 [Mycolicibacterium komanii]
MAGREGIRRLQGPLALLVILVALGLLLTCCPANRDGMPGQLASAMEETASAARSGAAALELWSQGRSTAQLAGVQLSDARTDVVKAYQGVADLRARDSVDVGRQRMLTDSMTDIIGILNAAAASIRQVNSEPAPQRARAKLLAAATALESRYR